jgi:PAS domain S-box-containing protein
MSSSISGGEAAPLTTASEDGEGHLPALQLPYAALFEAVSDAILVADAEGRYVDANPASEELLGYTRDELLQMQVSDIVARQPAWTDAEYARYQQQGQWRGELEVRRKDGTTVPVEARASVACLPNGPLFISAIRDLSAERLAEGRLRYQRQITETIANRAGEAFFVMDADGRATFVNPAAAELFGWDEDELLGQDLHATLHYEYHDGSPYPVAECPLRTVLQTGEALHRHEDVFFARDGRPIPVRCSNAPIEEDGRIVGAVLVVSDISDRIAAEARLRASETHLRRVLDSLFAFVGVLTPDGTLVEANKAPLAAAGLRAEDVLGRKFWDCYWWSYSLESQEQMRRAIERASNGDVVRHDAVVRIANERRIWIDFQLSPLRDDRGRITHLIPTGMDITVRKRLESQLRAGYEEIETIYRTAPIGLALVDKECRFVRVNDRLAEINGIPAERHIGARVSDIVPDLAADVEAIFRQVLDTGEPVLNVEFSGETAAKPGVRRWWSESWYPITDDAGRTISVNVVVEEITGRKLAEDERERLLGALAHDLKNPLAVMQGQAQLLRRQVIRRGVPEPEALIDKLEGFMRLTGRITNLVNELGDHALMAAGEPLELQREPIDLAAVVSAAVDELNEAPRSHTLDIEADTEPVVGEWDAQRLRRVVSNLLDNAVKYSPEGTRVVIRITTETGTAVLTVQDEGIGIPAADVPHVFDFQARASNVGATPGSGIGLAGAKWIVEQHGGSIGFVSEEKRGTIFTVRLPLAMDDTSGPEPPD